MYAQAKDLIRQSRSLLNQLVLSRTYLSLFWGYAGMFCLNILAYPVLTRIYGPQAFGELAVYSNTVLFLAGVGALSLEKAIILAKNSLRARNLLYLSVGILAVTSLLAGLVFYLFYEPLSSLLAIAGNLRYYWFLLPVIVFMAGTYQIASAGLLRKAAFRELSLLRFLLRASTLAVQFGLVLFIGTQFGLIAGFIGGFVLLFLILVYRYPYFIRSFRLNVAYSKQSWRRFSDIPRYSFPQSLFHHISSKVPFMMAAVFFGMQEVGYFSVAYTLLSIPEALIAAALGDLFFQKISSAANRLAIKKTLRHYWTGLLLIGLIPFGILLFYGESMVVFLMGETWRTTGKMLSTMAPMFLFTFMSTPVSSALTVIRKQKWELAFGIASLLVRPLVFYVGFLAGDLVVALAVWVVYEVAQLTFFNLMVYRMVSLNTGTE